MKIGIVQISSKLDPAVNMDKIKSLISSEEGSLVETFFLSECFYSMSDGLRPTPYLVENGNEHYKAIQSLATSHNVNIIGGSAATLEDGKIFNRSYNFDSKGSDLGIYDKKHLFSCDLGREKSDVVNEDLIYHRGDKTRIVDLGSGFKVGQSICFDIRYPKLYRDYVLDGANILSIPAAFTRATETSCGK